MRQRSEFADGIAARFFVWLTVVICFVTASLWAWPNYWMLALMAWIVVHWLIARRLRRNDHVTARRVLVWWTVSSAVALVITLFTPVPITSLSLDILSTRFSSQVILHDRVVDESTGTKSTRKTHGLVDMDAISRLTQGDGKVHFMLDAFSGSEDQTLELQFGRRGTAIYINDLDVGTDLAGIPIRLARWRGQALLDAPFLTPLRTELTLGPDGHLKMIGRTDRPVLQLDLSHRAVLANTPSGRMMVVRIGWLVLFLAALPLILSCVTSTRRLPRFGMRLLRWLEAP